MTPQLYDHEANGDSPADLDGFHIIEHVPGRLGYVKYSPNEIPGIATVVAFILMLGLIAAWFAVLIWVVSR